MHLELTDEQTEALIRELSLIIEYDPHGLGHLVDVHHHGPLEVGEGAGYCVKTLERLTSPAVAEAQPQCRVDGRSWVRRELCDPRYWGAWRRPLPLDRYRVWRD